MANILTLRQKEILEVMVESNRTPGTIERDFITSEALYDKKRKNFYKVCYEFVNGRWEGFVSIVAGSI